MSTATTDVVVTTEIGRIVGLSDEDVEITEKPLDLVSPFNK